MLLRHAKSDWHSDTETDYDRPLNHRGQKAIRKIAMAMRTSGIQPRLTLSSPARRAYQTVTRLYDALKIGHQTIHYLPDLYLADLNPLLQIVEQNQQADLMIVGHNPGLEELLVFLCGDGLPRTESGKLFPTASLAIISLPEGRTADIGGKAILDCLLRPKEIDSERTAQAVASQEVDI